MRPQPRSTRTYTLFPYTTPCRSVAGGVAANGAIRSALSDLAQAFGKPFVAPPLWLCTDNGAMIAWAGAERFAAGLTDPLSVAARPRWPLDQIGRAHV